MTTQIETLDQATITMVRVWLADDFSRENVERVARYIRHLGCGGLRQCRELVLQASQG